MDVSLNPKQAEFVRKKVESGEYLTPDEVVQEALVLLEDREALRAVKLEALRKEIAIGLEQADRGELIDGPEAFDRLRDRLRSRADSQR